MVIKTLLDWTILSKLIKIVRGAESNIALLMRKCTCTVCADGQLLLRLLAKSLLGNNNLWILKLELLHHYAQVMVIGGKRETMHAWSAAEGILQAAIVPAGPRRDQGTEKRTSCIATRDKFELAKHACSNSVGTSIFGHRHLCVSLRFWTTSFFQILLSRDVLHSLS